MRIRQVKPSFWGDAVLAAATEQTRLFYIGLWMLADDTGWLRWDPAEVGHELYGYEPRRGRERHVSTMFADLVERGRVELHDCGHAFIPTLRDHQRFASPDKQVRTIEREHAACRAQSAETREPPQVPAETRNGTERIGTVRKGEGVGGTARLPAMEPAPGGIKERLGDFADVVKPR
jgi:hypothetical protein